MKLYIPTAILCSISVPITSPTSVRIKSIIPPTVVPDNAPKIPAMVLIVPSTASESTWNNLAVPLTPSTAPNVANTASDIPNETAAAPPFTPNLVAILPHQLSQLDLTTLRILSLPIPKASSPIFLPNFLANLSFMNLKKSSINPATFPSNPSFAFALVARFPTLFLPLRIRFLAPWTGLEFITLAPIVWDKVPAPFVAAFPSVLINSARAPVSPIHDLAFLPAAFTPLAIPLPIFAIPFSVLASLDSNGTWCFEFIAFNAVLPRTFITGIVLVFALPSPSVTKFPSFISELICAICSPASFPFVLAAFSSVHIISSTASFKPPLTIDDTAFTMLPIPFSIVLKNPGSFFLNHPYPSNAATRRTPLLPNTLFHALRKPC